MRAFLLTCCVGWLMHRRPSSKHFVQQLQQRINRLEDVLAAHNITIDPQAMAIVRNNSSSDSHPPTPPNESQAAAVAIQPNTHQDATEMQALDAAGDKYEGLLPDFAFPVQLSQPAARPSFGPGLGSKSVPRPYEGITNSDKEKSFELSSRDPEETESRSQLKPEEILDRLCESKGQFSIGEGGQIQYYGSTLDFHSIPLLAPCTLDSDASALGCQDSALSGYPGLQQSLLDLFWLHPHPFLRILDRDAFLAGFRRGVRTPYFSQLLLTSISLRTIDLSDSPLAKNLTGYLLERAKEQLYIELEHPDLNTILSLLFLSNYFASQVDNGLGWLYIGD